MDGTTIHHGYQLAYSKDLRVIDCFVCGHAHLCPLPPEDEVTGLYSNDGYYSQYADAAWLAEKQAEHKDGLWDTCYEWQLGMLNGTSLLDVGCGYGWFGLYAKDKGVRIVDGVEPSSKAASMAAQTLGNSVYSDRPQLKYDLVRISYVLEHVRNPFGFIHEYQKSMNDNGRMLICIPNEFNPLQNKLALRHPGFFLQEPHINYFSKGAILALLNSVGMQTVDVSATFPTELFALAGFDYIEKPELGKRLHMARLQFEKAVGINAFKLYRMLNHKLGWGRGLFVLAEMMK